MRGRTALSLLFPLAVLAGIFNAPSTKARDFGVGLIFGEPTGLSGKYWMDRKMAMDFGLAYSFGDYLVVTSDVLVHYANLTQRKEPFFQQTVAYLGLGGALRVNNRKNKADRDSASLGVRVPLGLEWRPVTPSLGVFLELAPGMRIAPAIEGFLQGGIGARYYF